MSRSYCTGEKQVVEGWTSPDRKNPDKDRSIKWIILDPHGERVNFFYDSETGNMIIPVGFEDPGPDHERGNCYDLRGLPESG